MIYKYIKSLKFKEYHRKRALTVFGTQISWG